MSCVHRLPCPLTSGWAQSMAHAQETVTLPEVFKGEQDNAFVSCSRSLGD